MSFLPGNAQHIGARSSQQDSFGFGDPDDEAFLKHGGFVAVVCDGMGGLEYGDQASRTAVKAFLDAYQRKTPAETVPDALERAAREANERVIEMAHELGAAESVGTTLVAVVLLDGGGRDKRMYFISVGDSGLFHVSDGQMQTVNRPHVFANILDHAVTRGAMSKEQALLHPERESLTSFIGVDVLEEIDRNIEPWPLSDGDTILLASDGLFKTLTSDEMLTALHGHASQTWPEALVARTLEQHYEYQDNVTVLSVTLRDKPDTMKLPPPAVPLEKREAVVEAPARTKSSPRWVALALIILLVAVAASGARWWVKRHRANPHPVTETETK